MDGGRCWTGPNWHSNYWELALFELKVYYVRDSSRANEMIGIESRPTNGDSRATTIRPMITKTGFNNAPLDVVESWMWKFEFDRT